MHNPSHVPPTKTVSLRTIAKTTVKKIEERGEKIEEKIAEKKDEYNKGLLTIEQGIKEAEPLKPLEHTIQHLEQLVNDKVNKEIVTLEKKITEKIVANATKEELRELKEELFKEWKELEKNYKEDLRYIKHNFAILGFGTAIAVLFFLWHYTN